MDIQPNQIVSLKWYQSIRTKLFMAFSALVLFFAIFIYLYFPARLRDQALKGAQYETQSLANFLAFSISPAIDFDDSVSAEETMQAAKQNQDISYVVVTGKSGQRFVGYGDQHGAFEKFATIAGGQISEDGSLWKTNSDVMRQEVPIGKVYVGLSLAKLNEGVLESQRVIALISLTFIVLGLVFVFWIATILTSNLGRILVAVKGVGQGDFSRRAKVNSKDEVGILANSLNDMTERLESNTKALSQREAQFRNLAESMNEGLLQLGEDLHVRYANPRLCWMLGYAESDIIGKHLSQITGQDSLPSFDMEAQTQQMEVQVHTAAEEILWILMSYSFGLEEEGERRSMTVIFTDITHLKKTERDLVYKNRELDTFVYKASHDLKAPLSSLRGLVDIAKEEIKVPEATRYLSLIDRTIAKMDDVLQGLLEVTWIKQGALENQIIYLRDLAQTILRSIENAPGFDTVKIELVIPDHCQVVSDLKLLNSVLQNLMHNAIKYHRESGDDKWVKVIVQETQKVVRITIKDNGPGIPAHLHEKLFDMFFRASTKSQGSGLGLYIVKNSIEKVGGTIQLKSEVGLGSEFIVELPIGSMPT